MKMRNLLAVILICAACTIQPTHAVAGASTVQELYEQCKDKDLQSLCIGYISGVMDMMAVNGMVGVGVVREQFAMCTRTSHGAGIQAFKNWAEKHPERWQDPDYRGVVAAVSELWPCRGDNAPK